MKALSIIAVLLLFGCNANEKKEFTDVEIEVLMEDSVSIRAIELMGEDLAFAGNNGIYGLYDSKADVVRTNRQQYDSIFPEFRAVASTSSDFFMLSVGNPALLYKTGGKGNMDLVYKEENDKVFYDSMIFWNDLEGIAMGDPTEDCLSIIITRDGGDTWKKIPCTTLPKAAAGEAAFAASNSNIAVSGNNTWIISGGIKSRVFYSPNKGIDWEVYDTPLIQGSPTTGGYSIDFYDENNGYIIGGDYTNPEEKTANKAKTEDGGKTWKLVSDAKDPGYMSSIRYVPNGQGREIVSVGFSGIFYSADGGEEWRKLSSEGFYTIRFKNDTLAYAAGKNRIARLTFEK